MTKITIAVGKGLSGEIYRYEVDDEVKVDELMSRIISEIYNGDGVVEDFVLFNLTQGFEYRNDETLSSRGTRNGDVVLMIDLRKT
ncbi:hypothetical protein [Candidatus Chrysopegis kryptomonas]|uniref:Ubiquitin-like domain-containing protein n=1 Tax=Candidatus Chryseopegocella kryptomonas TaxID=1633643 RepID=A0A0P1MN98_9BACT|nr:hypothetical protein [Candidatus Chrysopegis kryptomonas]CUS96909.1 hypothetical protein JGI23_00204 [Candidatus Chrysopegis kryptomonas]